MFDVFLAMNLTTHAFSLKKTSLRFPTINRIFSVLFILPFFFLLIFVNRIFMLLDRVFFPGFRKMQLNNTGFIIGVPRSATTYLFNLMSNDNKQFTCFKLWEILFAPSVIQKYLLSAVIKIDRFIGRPLYRLSLFFDKLFLGKIAKLHEISFSKPEEDEMLMLYTFSSIYLSFFFPEVPALNSHLFFDEEVSAEKRKKLMLFYRSCIQRHVYFFDRREQKIFLSKNPSFVSKLNSIAETFPEAKLIYMLRSPLKTIPSTISLNLNVYSIFSGRRTENPLAELTTEAIIRWYKMADNSIRSRWLNRSVIVPFKKITGQPEETIKEIYTFLDKTPGSIMTRLLISEQENSRNYRSAHKYKIFPGIPAEISLNLDFIFNGKYRDELLE
jgi:hypothetical protein